MTFSRVSIAGVVASQPEKRFTPNNTAVTSFTLQVTPPPRGQMEAQPYTLLVTCWARTAESVAETVQPGATVLVEGRLLTKTDAQPDGAQKKTLEIEAQQIVIVNGTMTTTGIEQTIGGGAGAPAPAAPGMTMAAPMPAAAPQYQQQTSPPPAMAPAGPVPAYTDDDIPF